MSCVNVHGHVRCCACACPCRVHVHVPSMCMFVVCACTQYKRNYNQETERRCKFENYRVRFARRYGRASCYVKTPTGDRTRHATRIICAILSSCQRSKRKAKYSLCGVPLRVTAVRYASLHWPWRFPSLKHTCNGAMRNLPARHIDIEQFSSIRDQAHPSNDFVFGNGPCATQHTDYRAE